MSSLFGDSSEGHALRIYYPRPYKGEYVFIKDGVVTHASEPLVFTLGWTKEKVVERAEKVGFSVVRQSFMSMPRDTWISKAPITKAASAAMWGIPEPETKPRKPRKKKEK